MGGVVSVAVCVEGIVQGVGFRPFVHRLAHRYALSGRVSNDVSGVHIVLEGSVAAVDGFLAALRVEAPALAAIERVSVRRRSPTGGLGFTIEPTGRDGELRALVSADAATCVDCLTELADPADRRYRYPFVNCTNCGPRFSIVEQLPYDRPYTTMAGFTMCADCAREYHDPTDRRFHAQPVCCPACGPTLRLVDADGDAIGADPLAGAAALLQAGRIVAVKGIGGYHLAVDATDEPAVARLRARKHRDDKPFAVMVADLAHAHRLCQLDQAAAALLTGRQRPIVLAPRRDGADVAAAVAPAGRELGLLLAYTPLHHLLLGDVAGPLVMTSGNRSDEPIAYRDPDAVAALDGIADAWLTHDRPIRTRVDDSVARSWRGRPQLVRRSRGYAPEPLPVTAEFRRPVLACGAELKNTFCVGSGRRAFCSAHVGDLSNYETLRSFRGGIDHLTALLDVEPRLVAHDLHPDYLSTAYARELPGVRLVGVQHHHAHIASCLADNLETGPVLGVAFDGTGYGPDGTVWGGEFLLADLTSCHRLAHLAPVPLPGGAAAIRAPWRMAVSYLDAAYGATPPPLPVLRRHQREWRAVAGMGRRGINAPPTSSMGRLFDAVAAVLDVRDTIGYEGQASIELECRASAAEAGRYLVPGRDGEAIRGVELFRSVVADRLAGTPMEVVAARFHRTVAELVAVTCRQLAARTGVRTVALSGGVFGNRLLLDGCAARLTAAGLRVLTHSQVPCNDGGISLGQAAVAGALDRAGLSSVDYPGPGRSVR